MRIPHSAVRLGCIGYAYDESSAKIFLGRSSWHYFSSQDGRAAIRSDAVKSAAEVPLHPELSHNLVLTQKETGTSPDLLHGLHAPPSPFNYFLHFVQFFLDVDVYAQLFLLQGVVDAPEFLEVHLIRELLERQHNICF